MSFLDPLPDKPAIFGDRFLASSAKLGQTRIDIHPVIVGLADDSPMAGPGVPVQLFHGLDDLCADGVQMEVPDESEQIRLFITKNGFVAVLEEMAGS